MRVFLGGTCNEDKWREELIPFLNVDYFNPVVDDWTEDCIETENDEKINKCDIHLYVITDRMAGVYSIAEAVESAMTSGKSTIFIVNTEVFDNGIDKSMIATSKLIKSHGGIVNTSILNMQDVAKIINDLDRR